MKKSRDLTDIELQEVSLVDKAANKKKFLFFKQEKTPNGKKLKKKIDIAIVSDGTVGGTTISVNDEKITDLRDFSFYLYGGDDATNPVSCSYSKFVESDDGFSRSETFYLTKGEIIMDQRVQEKLNEYFGSKDEIDLEKAEDLELIVKALEVVNSYKGDFPDDLKKAVGSIAKQAGLFVPSTSSVNATNDDDETGVEKAGAKFSKETLKKITEAIEALKSVMPALKEDTEKVDSANLAKVLEGLKETVDKIGKKEGESAESAEDTDLQKLTKSLKEMSDRLTKVESSTPVRKGLEGQDDDGDNDDGVQDEFPSITI